MRREVDGRRVESVVVERAAGAGGSEVRRRLAGPRDTSWGQRKLPVCRRIATTGYAANEPRGADCAVCRLRAVCPVGDN